MGHFVQDPLELAVVERAEAQWGLLRRIDLLELGLRPDAIRHRARSGRLHELHPGVYALGHRALTRKAEYLAAVWWCGGDAALAQESACAFYRWTEEDWEHPGPVHVTTTRCKRPRPGVVVHQTRRLPFADVLRFERLLRVTDHARTLVDRADHLPYRALRLLADQPRGLSLAAVERTHLLLPGRRGWKCTELLVRSEDARARSVLERRWTAYLVHHRIRLPDARNVDVGGCVVDCVWHEPRLALELDSRAHHDRRAAMLEDKRRDRAYRAAGYLPVRVMWEELEPGEEAVALELRALL